MANTEPMNIDPSVNAVELGIKLGSLEAGQRSLETGQRNLERKVEALETGQRALEVGQKNLEQKVGSLEVIQQRMEGELKALAVDVKGLSRNMWMATGALALAVAVLPPTVQHFLPSSRHQIPVSEPLSQHSPGQPGHLLHGVDSADVVTTSELGQVTVHVLGGKPAEGAVVATFQG